VFDIGSGSVGAAVIALSQTGKPKALFSVREQMVFQENLKFDRFVSSMLDALEKAARALQDFPLPPNSGKSFSIFFASPWYASQTRAPKKTFSSPTVITEKLLRDTEEKEAEDFKAFEMKKLGNDAVVLETQNMQVKLNGYETSSPEGKTASVLETSFYVSIVPQKIMRATKEKIAGLFHNRSVFFYTFSFSTFAVVRDIFFHQKNFLSLDISGEVTDVSVVRDNVLEETRTFPQGKNFLLRKIAGALGASHEEALSYLAMAASKKLAEGEEQKMKKIMADAGGEWLSGLQKTLSGLSEGGSLPHDMFFAADENVSAWFAEYLQGTSEIFPPDTPFAAHYLNAAFLSSFCESGQGVARDPFLMIEAVFLSKLIE